MYLNSLKRMRKGVSCHLISRVKGCDFAAFASRLQDRMAEIFSDSSPFKHKWKLVYTVALCMLSVAYGLLFEITASTLVDIAEQTSSSLEDVTFSIVVRTSAYALGSLFFGWAFERMNRQLGVTFVLTAMAVNAVITPYESSLIMFHASMLVNGICGAAVDISGMTWMLEMWTASKTSSLLMLYVFYNIAAAIVNAVAAPFLSSEQVRFNSDGTTILKESMIVIPYLMRCKFWIPCCSYVLNPLLLQALHPTEIKHRSARHRQKRKPLS